MLENKDTYIISTNKNKTEIRTLLFTNTLSKQVQSSISREMTDKKFIGSIDNNGFSIIDSTSKGVLCRLDGVFVEIDSTQTSIEIKTSMQRVFSWIFYIWALLIVVAFIIIMPISYNNEVKPPYIAISIIICVARLALYIAYNYSKKSAIKKIESLIF